MAPCSLEDLNPMIAASSARAALAAGWEGHPSRWLRRCVEAVLKGFAIGSGLKGGLAVLSALVRLRSLIAGRARKPTTATTSAEGVAGAVKETVRYGMFLGAFAGSYVSVDEFISAMWGRERTASWRSLVAGLIAGPTMLLSGLRTTHTSLATYILVRAGVLAARCGMKNKRFGMICKPLTWSHGDIFIMCVSSAQIGSAYILNRDSFPSSYKAFLGKQIGKDPIILQGLKELVNNSAFTNLAGIEKYYKTIGVNLKLDPKMRVPCSILHGNRSCTGHFFSFLLQAYGRAFPVYVPVYLIPTLVVHRTRLIKRPFSMLGKNLLGIARSSLFLSVYCASEWGWTCMLFRTFQRCNIPLLVLGTFPTGLALLVEKKSRRMEISLYCLARAIESLSSCMADTGLLPSIFHIKRADVVVFSLATSVIMHCYAQEREVFRSKYLNVLDWFPTGLALLVEKKSRRMEISLYCLARAIESLSSCMADTGLLPSIFHIKRVDVVVFSLATSVIMHCYAQEREVFRSKYLNVLDWFPTGLALLVEKKSRRMEISLYCLARAIESLSSCMADTGLLPSIFHIKRADVVVFSLATSVIMHCYAQEREVFRSKYLNVLDWVFGVPAPSQTNKNKQNVLH